MNNCSASSETLAGRGWWLKRSPGATHFSLQSPVPPGGIPILTAIGDEPGAEEVVATGTELAGALDEEFVACHVIREGDDVTEADAEASVRDRLAGPVDDPAETTVSIRTGPGVAHEILAEARRIGADYIVLGTRERTPIGKALLGSDSGIILLNSETPVVSVGPPDE